MNKELLRRIFAIIALVGIVGVTVFGTLVFFNLFSDYAALFGALAVAFACVAAVFFILTYILRPMSTDVGKPEDFDSDVAGGEAGDGQCDVDDCADVKEDGVTDEEGKDEQD